MPQSHVPTSYVDHHLCFFFVQYIVFFNSAVSLTCDYFNSVGWQPSVTLLRAVMDSCTITCDYGNGGVGFGRVEMEYKVGLKYHLLLFIKSLIFIFGCTKNITCLMNNLGNVLSEFFLISSVCVRRCVRGRTVQTERIYMYPYLLL